MAGVESYRFGDPRGLAGAFVAMFGVIAISNAHLYPPIGGFDAAEHIDYARAIADRGELPVGGASYTPPGFYLLAAAAIKVGDAINLADAERAALYLNAGLGIGAALLLWWLARLIFPGRPILTGARAGLLPRVPDRAANGCDVPSAAARALPLDARVRADAPA